MRKIKSILGFVLIVLIVLNSVPALANYSTEDIDRMFLNSFGGIGIYWERTAYGNGTAKDITENARLDSHDYTFRVMSDGTGVAEVSLSGWFSDLRMNPDGTFPLGLEALTACVYAVDTLVPTYNASLIVSPYDVYDVLWEGKLYDTTGTDGWRFLEVSTGRIEAVHDSGAYLIMSVNGPYFNFTYTSH